MAGRRQVACVQQHGPTNAKVAALDVARGGIEPPTRGFSAVVAGSRGLIINRLQRLPPLSPGTPRHTPDTPNLSWSHSWHMAQAKRQLGNR